MRAILSDIHGNLEALNAVLTDAAEFNADSIFCLGDTIGYGPDPIACLEQAMEWDTILAGEHEAALLRDRSIGPAMHIANRSLERLYTKLTQWRRGNEFIEFISSLTASVSDEGTLYVHGSPRHPLNEYLFPEDVYNIEKIDRVWSEFDALCFCGHTHIPGLITNGRNFVTPLDCDFQHRVQEKLICNVGSVGQPRDGDIRACYVLFDGQTIQFRRVPYDLETTQAKLRDNDGGDFTARLGDGQ